MTKHALKIGTRQSIPLSDLKAHPKAQRNFDAGHAAQMVAAFDPALLGTITVARTKRGALWIVDGQHRTAATLQWLDGDKTQCIECNVIDVESDEDAAKLFLGLNNHKSVQSLDKFLVRVVACDPVALGIVATLESVGLRVHRSRGDGVVQAVAACEFLFKKQRGALLLERVVRVLHDAWGSTPDAYHEQLIRGLGALFAKHGTAVEDEDLVRKIAKRSGPLSWIGRARALRDAKGGSLAAAMCECIQEEYNKGRRIGRLTDKAA